MLSGRPAQLAAVVATTALVVDPMEVVASVNSGYESHPDHKGAAEFMKAQHIVDADVIIAEDVLQQTYYLGTRRLLADEPESRAPLRGAEEWPDPGFLHGCGCRQQRCHVGGVAAHSSAAIEYSSSVAARIRATSAGYARATWIPCCARSSSRSFTKRRDGLTQVWRATGAPPSQSAVPPQE